MTQEMDKRYSPAEIEQRWYRFWEAEGYFTPDVASDKPPFSIVIPPPNVTGRLHIGHALVNSLQDFLVRWKRMSGFNTLWVPGTDHAGIATQMVVERELAKQGCSRFQLGREGFEKRVWQWKEEYGDAIVSQLKRLGVSCDWTRMRFTLDEGLSRAVRHVFVKLYEDGLIYRALAMVNWCPQCQTAISDIEVEHRETHGKLYEIDYPLTDGSGVLTVATTRPETMLGDTALAVHPDDERYRHLIGSSARLPIANRVIPIVGDAILVDPKFGTGVVKVTPAHDKNDYEAGLRNNLPQLQVIDEKGVMTSAAGPGFEGLNRFDARKRVVQQLENENLLRKTKDYLHNVGFHGKCDTIIESMVSRQWFVKIEPLARPAIEAVRNGTIKLVPQNWDSTYFNWMENIHDWCISRQLWWGHRIPAYTCSKCGEITVSETAPTRCPKCDGLSLVQESDVLDTWFSSALWPFSTMGWPENTPDYRTFYPTRSLITGFDILFFWVARMIMMGLRFTGKAPFSEVYLHGLVRDEQNRKMSKTLGNVIDPLEVIEEFGADAVRFTLAIVSSGREIPLARNRMQGYAAFATKIWNASRFALTYIDTPLRDAKPIDFGRLSTVERWILSRLNATARDVDRAMSNYRFDEASNALYQFFWHEFCDWYIEMAKPVLSGREGTPESQQNARRVLLDVLDKSLRLLHPFMPFITEEIWQKLNGADPSLMVAAYPKADEARVDAEAERQIAALQEMVTLIRNLRAEKGFTPKDRFVLFVNAPDAGDTEFFRRHNYLLTELARLSEVRFGNSFPPDAHLDSIRGIAIAVQVPEKTASPEELARIQKQIEQLTREIESTKRRLQDASFVERAPAHVVEGARQREAELVARLEKLRQNIG
jgi:valyl-tRNA synthetase